MPFTPFDFNDEWASAWEWARMYRALGWQVTPAHTPKGESDSSWKRPVLDWTEFQTALIPDSLFARWYDPNTGEHRQRRNMGIIVTPPADPAEEWAFVVDLDVTPGKNGLGWWQGLVAVHANGLEPETPSQVTGGGGRQMIFRGPPGWVPPTNKTPIGVDFRGKGGFWMAPPSMHASGRIYDWEPGREPWAVAVADAEPWLIEAIEKLVGESHVGATATLRTASIPEGQSTKNPFGRDLDGREAKLTAIAWALVVDFRRASEELPATDDLAREMLRAFTQYELTTKSRLELRPGQSNSDLLELEGRGWTAFSDKVTYALQQWGGKVAEAAKVPKPEDPAPVGLGAALAAEFDSESRPVTRSRSVGDFHGDPPERRWLVEGWVPQGELISMYGAGGAGKSLLALQLAYCMATARPWLGLEVRKASSLMVSCEDGSDELHRRHAAMKAGLGFPIGNPFGAVRVWDRKGENNLLVTHDGKGGLASGPFLTPLREELAEVQPDFLILDTLADVFGGNEVDRVHVNGFLKTALGGLILERRSLGHDLTVLLLGHPSRSGEESGRGFSGSTAWEAGVRARLYVTTPEKGGAHERILTRAKANYAGGDGDGDLSLILEAGVFIAADRDDEIRVERVARTVATEVGQAWEIGSPYMTAKGHPRFIHRALVQRLTMPDQPPELVRRGLRRAIDDGLIKESANTGRRGWKQVRNESAITRGGSNS